MGLTPKSLRGKGFDVSTAKKIRILLRQPRKYKKRQRSKKKKTAKAEG